MGESCGLFKCEDCGEIFSVPKIYEWKEAHGDGPSEKWASFYCPLCGSEDILPWCEPEEDPEGPDD